MVFERFPLVMSAHDERKSLVSVSRIAIELSAITSDMTLDGTIDIPISQ